MENQIYTYFSSGIEEERNKICIDIFCAKLFDLEEGQIIDLTIYEDINFFNFLHQEFIDTYLEKESYELYSVKKLRVSFLCS